MQYGLMMVLSPREPIARFPTIAKRAEELGFSTAWLGESQLIAKDAYVALALAARETNRIQLGPGVANPVTRHPTVLANTMAALHEISAGRSVLGIGTGDSAVRTIGAKPATVAELGTCIDRIRALLNGEEVDLDGHGVQLLTANGPLPIFVSASQPRMLRLAGAKADGVVLMGGAEPGVTQWQLDHIQAGAREAGRSLDDVFIDLWFAIAVDEDRAQARKDVSAWVTSQARFFAKWKALPTSLQPFAEEFERAYRSYDFYHHLSRHAEHAQGVSEELIDLLAVAGPVDACVEKIAALRDLKIDQITFTLLSGGRMERLRRLGEELIPALRA